MIIDVNVLTNWWTIAGVIASFLVALIALLLGINSNRRINNLRKDEKRECNLRAIIDWATRILESNRDAATIVRVVENKSTSDFGLRMEQRANINILTWEAVYIGYLAQAIKEVKLIEVVEGTRILIRQHVKVLDLLEKKKFKDNTAVKRHRTKLDTNAKKVIELAVQFL